MLVDLLLRLNSENTDGRYRYDVISSESLLIRNSPIINLLIGILRYIQDPSIELNRLLAVYEYNSRKFKASDDAVILSYFEDRENIGRHLDNDFFSFVESIRKESLFEMCERIVSYFQMRGLTKVNGCIYRLFKIMFWIIVGHIRPTWVRSCRGGTIMRISCR